MIPEVGSNVYGHIVAAHSGSVDCGDYVVVTNARKIRVTGDKEKQIIYRHHTMYPGGLKEKSYRDLMAHRPEEVRMARICDLSAVPVNI